MNINLHIERLILDGIDIPPLQSRQMQAAVAAAIQEQLLTQGIDFTTGCETWRRSVIADSIAIADSPNAESLGHQIGRAVYGGIGK